MNEEWRDVIGYENLYAVSNTGRVRSKRNKTRIEDKQTHIMRTKLDDKGYLRVNLYKNGTRKAKLVSRLVADAFIPNPNNLPHVGHDDDIQTNNCVNNLYWTDPSENNRHNGKLERLYAAHNQKIDIVTKKLSTKIKGVAVDGTHEIMFESIRDAHRNGFDEGKISMCINGKRNKHKGYRWERRD